MYCNNCGKELKENQKVCLECGKLVEKEKSKPSPKKPMALATKLCIISLCLKYALPIVVGLLNIILSFFTIFGVNSINLLIDVIEIALWIITGFSGLAAFILVIVAKVKDKDSLFATILLWIYIAELIISILVGIIALILILIFGIGIGALAIFAL